MIVFALVDAALESEARDAFNWHRGFSAANDAIFPRTPEQFRSIALAGHLWRAIDSQDGSIVGLCYAVYEPHEKQWEVGGLMVARPWTGKGVGAALMRLAVAHLLLSEDPLRMRQTIIAHVLAGNNEPRPIIENALRFRRTKPLKVPGDALPGLRTDDEGFVNGDEFEIAVPETLNALADWCQGWSGALKEKIEARIEIPTHSSMQEWATDLREIAANPYPPAT